MARTKPRKRKPGAFRLTPAKHSAAYRRRRDKPEEFKKGEFDEFALAAAVNDADTFERM